MLKRAKSEDRREHLREELHLPPFPQSLSYLWHAFLRLSRRRSGGMSFNPIAWRDIEAYCALTRFRLVPWEIEIIEELDDLWLTEQAKRNDKDGEAPERDD